MDETLSYCGYAPSKPSEPPPPKTYEESVVAALDSIARDLNRLTRLLETVIEPESSDACRAAVRTTGR
jgi:hypothetical protein